MSHARIRKDELDFLEREGIGLHYVADMRDRVDWQHCSEFLHAIDCYVAWGFRQCSEGHRLTNSRGQCIQCDKQSIGFMRGWIHSGEVYLIVSAKGRLVKIGWAGDAEHRLKGLRAENHAGVSDWRPLRRLLCNQPARLEKALHDRLDRFREPTLYMRYNIARRSRELFSCSPATAVRTWNRLLAERPEW